MPLFFSLNFMGNTMACVLLSLGMTSLLIEDFLKADSFIIRPLRIPSHPAAFELVQSYRLCRQMPLIMFKKSVQFIQNQLNLTPTTTLAK